MWHAQAEGAGMSFEHGMIMERGRVSLDHGTRHGMQRRT